MKTIKNYLVPTLAIAYLLVAAASPFILDAEISLVLLFVAIIFFNFYTAFQLGNRSKENSLLFKHLSLALNKTSYATFKDAIRDTLRLQKLLSLIKQGLEGLLNGEKVEYTYFDNNFIGSSIVRLLKEVESKFSEKSKEETRQIWSMRGLAEFSDILKNDDQSLNDRGDQIIGKLVKHLNINQGGIFLKQGENDKAVMKLISCYAYDKKKYTNKTIKPREGLVGQCWMEMDPVIVSDIPDQYMEITSGLGHKTASFIAVYPLCYNEEVVGVIELASFRILEAYELEFIEKLCSNIAGFLHSKMMNESLRNLLQNTEKMNMTLQEQEEELRQNAEEMHATQEMLERKVNSQYRCIKQLQDTADNNIINAAGRNRMLTQKMGYYSQLVTKGKRDAIIPLTQAVELHDECISVFKSGGTLAGVGDDDSVQSIYKSMSIYIDRIEEVWLPFKKSVLDLVMHFGDEEADLIRSEALKFVEENLETLVTRNNDLVNAYSKENNEKRQNIFDELESSLKVA